MMFPQITGIAGWGGQYALKNRTKLFFFFLYSFLYMSIVWDRLSELEMCLDGRVELHIDEKEVLDAASGGTAEWEMEREELWMPAHSSSLPSYEHTHTHTRSDLALHLNMHVSCELIHSMCEGMYMYSVTTYSAYGCVGICVMIAPWLTSKGKL